MVKWGDIDLWSDPTTWGEGGGGATVLGDYRFVIADRFGDELDEVPALNPTWSYNLNAPGSASFTLPLLHEKCTPSLLAVGQRELHIYREQELKWGGRLWNVSAGSQQGEEVRFGFEGYFGTFSRRLVTATQKFTNEDQLEIAWGLIDYTQGKDNGDLGIVRDGIASSGIIRDRTYPFWERARISDEIVALSELSNGFDFEITPDKRFIMHFPSKGLTRARPYDLYKNIVGFGLVEDAQGLVNSYSAIGAGDGKQTCIAVSSDSVSQELYGLLEEAESFTNVKRFNTLTDRATEGLRINKRLRRQPGISLMFVDEDAYADVVGDRIHIIAHNGYIQFDQQMRLISKTFQLNNQGREVVTVEFDEGTEI